MENKKYVERIIDDIRTAILNAKTAYGNIGIDIVIHDSEVKHIIIKTKRKRKYDPNKALQARAGIELALKKAQNESYNGKSALNLSIEYRQGEIFMVERERSDIIEYKH